MPIYVANPLYDSVFKYLMEDERIAKTMLSALLQKQVVAVEMRRNEYSNVSREAISMFRVDFAATIREDNGEERLILIELQKTWLATETLRFRQYLAVQYNNKENMRKETKDKYALPTVAVYLLGHRVGDINEPVVYARHKIYDYDGNEVMLPSPDPFVESLQHDSIIVQIPLLRGKVNNRLERVLSIFDQSQALPNDQREIKLDEEAYSGDEDMSYIIHRLLTASADPDVRIRMNAEDEFFKELEDRDTELMQTKKELKEQKEALKQQKEAFLQQKEALEQQKEALEQQKDALQQKDAAIKQQAQAIHSAIQALHHSGMPVSTIAMTMGITEDEVKKIIG